MRAKTKKELKTEEMAKARVEKLRYACDLVIKSIAKTYGLLFEDKSLFLMVGNDSTQSEKILLTNIESVYIDFLGYRYDHYLKDFESTHDVINFITSGRYFCVNTLKHEFAGVDYEQSFEFDFIVSMMELVHSHAIINFDEKSRLDWIFDYFPHIRSEYVKASTRIDMNNIYARKYNVEIVKQVTNIKKDEDAVELMASINAKFGSEKEKFHFFLSASEGEIRAIIASSAIKSGFPENSIVDKAAKFAAAAHAFIDQRRKYTGEPYINHPAQVAGLVGSVTSDKAMIAAAYLHDVIEDVGHAIPNIRNKIKNEFGEEIYHLVDELTDVSQLSDGDRATRKSIDRAHTSQASEKAKTIKLADIISNSKSIIENDSEFAKVYMEEKALLLEVLKEGNKALYKVAEGIMIDYQVNRINQFLNG